MSVSFAPKPANPPGGRDTLRTFTHWLRPPQWFILHPYLPPISSRKEPPIPNGPAPTFFLTAAEHSGDALGAALIAALKHQHPTATFVGVGGPRMAAAGCRLLANPVGRSAMLVGAVFSQARYWFKLLRVIRQELATLKPAVVIPIDSSAVNLRVAAIAKQQKIPVCYYVAPQLWATRPWRITAVRARVDTLCCILPFEQAYFGKQGVHTVYVGHPMFDHPANSPDTDPARMEPPLPGDPATLAPSLFDAATAHSPSLTAPRVALFPGSRKAEIDHNLPPMLEILSEIKGRFPRATFVAVAPSDERAWQIRHYLRHTNLPASVAGVDIRIAHADAVIRWADLVLTKSGTSTLQVAHHHKPMVVMYAVAAWKWHLAGRWLVNTKYISLVNILADRQLVPEFVPFYGSPLPVARKCIELLSRPDLRDTMARQLADLTAPLQPPLDPQGQPLLAADRVAAEVTRLARFSTHSS